MRLPFLGGVYSRKPDLVLSVLTVEYRDGVAVRYGYDSAMLNLGYPNDGEGQRNAK